MSSSNLDRPLWQAEIMLRNLFSTVLAFGDGFKVDSDPLDPKWTHVDPRLRALINSDVMRHVDVAIRAKDRDLLSRLRAGHTQETKESR